MFLTELQKPKSPIGEMGLFWTNKPYLIKTIENYFSIFNNNAILQPIVQKYLRLTYMGIKKPYRRR